MKLISTLKLIIVTFGLIALLSSASLMWRYAATADLQIHTAELLAALKPGAEIEVDAYVGHVGSNLFYFGWAKKSPERNPTRLGILIADTEENRHGGQFFLTITSSTAVTALPPDNGLLGRAVVPVYQLDTFLLRDPKKDAEKRNMFENTLPDVPQQQPQETIP